MQAKQVLKDGLCSTCINSSGCMYLATRTVPAHFCEQFSTYAPPVKTRNANPTVTTVNNPGPFVEKANGHLGLCVTCDDSGTCMYTNREGGVWHCEEYH